MYRLPSFYVGDSVQWILGGFQGTVEGLCRQFGRGPFIVADIKTKRAADNSGFHHQTVGITTPTGIHFISGHLLEVI